MATPDNELGPTDDETPQRTRKEQKQDAEAYSVLAEELVKGKATSWPDPPFYAALQRAIVEARDMVKNARRRQIRRVALLLRQTAPVAELRDALQGRTPQLLAQQEREHTNEAWRARLRDEGDPALAEFVAQYPDADHRLLRQLVRRANKTPADLRAKKAATTLLREIRAVRNTAAPPEPADE